MRTKILGWRQNCSRQSSSATARENPENVFLPAFPPSFIYNLLPPLLSNPSALPRILSFSSISSLMDLSKIARKLDLSDSETLTRKAGEFRRLSDLQFNSSAIGVVSFYLHLFQFFCDRKLFDFVFNLYLVLGFLFLGWGLQGHNLFGNRRYEVWFRLVIELCFILVSKL